MTGCNQVSRLDIDNPVTSDILNTSGEYTARGYVEAIYNDDEAMFAACFPTVSMTSWKQTSGDDIFGQYKQAMAYDGTFLGTAFKAAQDYTTEGGYSEDDMRDSISLLMDIPAEDITAMQMEAIEIFFSDGEKMCRRPYIFLCLSIQAHGICTMFRILIRIFKQMRFVVTDVTDARVDIDNETYGKIDRGFAC